jgi:6,7-dimethyl-8-ribityllumazine synthase
MDNPAVIEADKIEGDPRIAIVLSKYNGYIVDRLLDGCLETLASGGINKDSITVVKVPGAYEIPVTVRILAGQGKFSAIITLGAVIRGETPHFDLIAGSCSEGIAAVALEYNLPVIFGVLTVNSVEQAMDRSGESESNMGAEAAKTALEMISIVRKLTDD